MPQINAVLFDFDDTLVDWSQQANNNGEIYRRHVNNVYDYLRETAVALPDRDAFFQGYRNAIIHAWQEAKKTWAGVNFVAIWQQTLATFDLHMTPQQLDTLLQVFAWQPVPGVVLYPDTIETLATLRARGYKLGLVTNSMMPMWMRDIELAAYHLLDYFDARATSGDVGYMKPHPAIYQHVLQQLGVPPQQAVFVGDRPENDIAGANELGFVTVLMSPPHLNHEDTAVQPHFIIKQLRELPPILAALANEV